MTEATGQRAIRFDEPLHSIGEELHVQPLALRQALAWSVGSELVRRHPDSLRLTEGFVHQHSVSLSVRRRSQTGSDHWGHLAYLVYGREWAHITNNAWSTSYGGRFNWLEVLLTTDRRSYVVEQLERAEGLPVPPKTPATTASSIGPRLLSAFLDRTALGPLRWIVTNGYGIDDENEWVNTHLFDRFPGALRQLDEVRAAERGLPPESRFWFVERKQGDDAEAVAHAAIDAVSGMAWTDSGAVNLLQRYHQLGRRIDALVSEVLPPTH